VNGPRTLPALLTPFDDSGHLDTSRYADYLSWLEEGGVDGHFAFGTTGEGLTLSVAERKAGLEAIMRHARRPVFVHVGAMNYHDTEDLLAHAESVGAAAAAVVSPSYYTHDAAALVSYFAGLGAATQMPLMLYNIPSHSASDISPRVAASLLAETDRYTGIKDSSRDATRLALYRDLGLNTYTGAESLVLHAHHLDAGSITGLAAAFPRLVVAAAQQALTADGGAAQRAVIQTRQRLTGPYVQSLREAARLSGMNLGPPRPPFRALNPDELTAVRDAWQYSTTS